MITKSPDSSRDGALIFSIAAKKINQSADPTSCACQIVLEHVSKMFAQAPSDHFLRGVCTLLEARGAVFNYGETIELVRAHYASAEKFSEHTKAEISS